jgi:hypothetical protein
MAILSIRAGLDVLGVLGGAILGVWTVVDVVRVIVRAISLDPNDRVLRLEALALASFWSAVGLMAIYFHFHHAFDALDLLWVVPLFAPFAVFTGLAGGVAIGNWVRRKRGAA